MSRNGMSNDGLQFKVSKLSNGLDLVSTKDIQENESAMSARYG